MSEVEHGLVISFPNQPVGSGVLFIFANRPFRPDFYFPEKSIERFRKDQARLFGPHWSTLVF
jgi:hypothetical protein